MLPLIREEPAGQGPELSHVTEKALPLAVSEAVDAFRVPGDVVIWIWSFCHAELLITPVCPFSVAEALEKEGFTIDKHQIHLEKPIKDLGLFHIPVKLQPEVSTELKVWIVKS